MRTDKWTIGLIEYLHIAQALNNQNGTTVVKIEIIRGGGTVHLSSGLHLCEIRSNHPNHPTVMKTWGRNNVKLNKVIKWRCKPKE